MYVDVSEEPADGSGIHCFDSGNWISMLLSLKSSAIIYQTARHRTSEERQFYGHHLDTFVSLSIVGVDVFRQWNTFVRTESQFTPAGPYSFRYISTSRPGRSFEFFRHLCVLLSYKCRRPTAWTYALKTRVWRHGHLSHLFCCVCRYTCGSDAAYTANDSLSLCPLWVNIHFLFYFNGQRRFPFFCFRSQRDEDHKTARKLQTPYCVFELGIVASFFLAYRFLQLW